MANTLTSKGQVTIPKRIRDSLGLKAGSKIDFVLNESGDVVVKPASARMTKAKFAPNRFELARGRADVKWRTDDLMKLLRPED